MLSFATQTITRQRPMLVDDGHGNQIPDWSNPDSLDIPGCSVQPGASQEDLINRDATLIAYTVWAPAGADVNAGDHVTFGSTIFEVDGEPERWATGILDHTKILLTRWEG